LRLGEHFRLYVALVGMNVRAMLDNCAKRKAWDWVENDVQVK